MKILMVIDAWYPLVGGGQVHVWELSKKLADLGNEIVIYTRNLGKWDESYPGIKVIRVGYFKNFANPLGRIEFLFLAQIYALFADYDILHLHAFSPGLIAPAAKLFRRKKIVYTMHGEGMKIAGFGMGSKFLENLVFYKIPYDLEISVAKQTLKQKPTSTKVIVVPNGVDIDRFKKAQRRRMEVKKILFVGRLAYDKGADLLIEAFKRLKNPNLELIIVGDGVELDNLKDQAKGLNIVFKGRLEGSELIGAYKEGDLLVIPSRVEGIPLRLFEAWVAKLPVVSTRVGDVSEFIEHNKTGYLAEISSDSLAKVLSEAVKNKNNFDIADKAYERVQDYSWDKISKQTFAEYQKL